MKTTPVKGTNDYTPIEAEVRDYLQDQILAVYRKYGFERIVTPIIEDSENLDKSEGGDNLNLVFKIMKRGDKLQAALNSGQFDQLADMGLRYDLTLPLCRYVANNQSKLIYPFKVIQMGSVYRAERPQRGRLREFTQCDIDVIGSASPNIEIELLHVASEALIAIGLKAFTVKVNDRRVLKSMLLGFGFAEADLDSVSISFDKLDKIGVSGVTNELIEKGFSSIAVDAFRANLDQGGYPLDELIDHIDDKVVGKNLKYIIDESSRIAQETMRKFKDVNYRVVFDPSLVRGQGYYTGTVFEIASDEFKGAISGGGRYDNLIGKFIHTDVPAVGISIGFERIFSILMASGFQIPNQKRRIVMFYEPNDFPEAFKKAESLRDTYTINLLERPKKIGPYLEKLKGKNITGFINFGVSDDISEFN